MNDDKDSHKTWLERLSQVLHREPQDRQQLIELLRNAKAHELLDEDALKMIEGVLQVSEMKVRDIMVPRPQMTVINADSQALQVIPTIVKSTHSRFPVTGESRDDVIGILLAKDLLPFALQPQDKQPTIHTLARPATFVPESKKLDVLLKEFRQKRYHMAIVVDEYGGVAGLVTIEDVLEQIVGDIEDEYDIAEAEPSIKPTGNDEYIVKALTPIDDFNRYFYTEFSDEDFDTIGGLVLQHFSHLPKQGESITINQFEVTVTQAGNRGIKLLRFKKLPKEETTIEE